jgi:hypothetical protein
MWEVHLETTGNTLFWEKRSLQREFGWTFGWLETIDFPIQYWGFQSWVSIMGLSPSCLVRTAEPLDSRMMDPDESWCQISKIRWICWSKSADVPDSVHTYLKKP